MAKTIYPTEISYRGPFLFKFKTLKEIDDIFLEEWGNLLKYKTDKILKEEERIFAESDNPFSKSQIHDRVASSYGIRDENLDFKVIFKSGKIVIGKSFTEIAQSPDLKQEYPVSFSIKMSCADISANIQTSSVNNRIILNIPNHFATNQLKFKLDRLFNSNEAPFWIRTWSIASKFHWGVSIWILLLLIIFAFHREDPYDAALDAYQTSIKKEATNLLMNGVHERELIKAVELDLKLNAKYLPPGTKLPETKRNPVFFVFFVISVVFFTVLSIAPKTILGIGRGELLIKRWNLWIKCISVTMPGIIASSVVYPLISKYIIH